MLLVVFKDTMSRQCVKKWLSALWTSRWEFVYNVTFFWSFVHNFWCALGCLQQNVNLKKVAPIPLGFERVSAQNGRIKLSLCLVHELWQEGAGDRLGLCLLYYGLCPSLMRWWAIWFKKQSYWFLWSRGMDHKHINKVLDTNENNLLVSCSLW